jgi:hypothetical protein
MIVFVVKVFEWVRSDILSAFMEIFSGMMGNVLRKGGKSGGRLILPVESGFNEK